MTDHESKMRARNLIASMADPRRGQVFRHYKGGYYSIVSVSHMEGDPNQIMVTYASNRFEGDTTRTLADFTALVDVADVDGTVHQEPRFARVPS